MDTHFSNFEPSRGHQEEANKMRKLEDKKRRRSTKMSLPPNCIILILLLSAGSLPHQVDGSPQVFLPTTINQANSQNSKQNSPEVHLVKGLAGSSDRIELPCLVDQLSCGEVYYITWTRQALYPVANGSQQQQQPQWTRVYLYTGANDSAPHKPIGDLLNRANFIMPEKEFSTSLESSAQQLAPTNGANDFPDDLQTGQQTSQNGRQVPMARLVIEEPKLSDEALYKCDVTYVRGKCPSISLVRVQMMALPNKAQIFVSANQQQQQAPSSAAIDGQLIGPYQEHEQLRLTCRVSGGRPQPSSVIWRKIDPSGRTINLMPAKLQQAAQPTAGRPDGAHLQQVVEVGLSHTLTSADLGAKFECHVEHEAMAQPAARIVNNELSGGQQRSTQDDAMLDLHPAAASASGSDEGEHSRSRQSLDSHVFVDMNVGVASLDLFMAKVSGKRNSSEPLKEDDLVELECVAYNSKPAANITWFNGSDSIEPLDAPQVSVGVQQQHPVSSGRSQRHRHRRLLQRNQVHQNSDGLTYNTHSFLSIKLSRNEHRAQISCKAQNGPMRQPVTKSLELQVEHAPIVLMEPAAGLAVSESGDEVGAHPQEVSIYCIYSANPSDLMANSTRWFKDGQQLNLTKADANHFSESVTPTGYPVLTIRKPNRRQAGLYECQLANAIGLSERLPASEHCKLEVNFRPSVQLRLLKQAASNLQLSAAASDHHHHQTAAANSNLIPSDQLNEVDFGQELILTGSSFVLACDVLEAQPSKIQKYQWFRTPLKARNRVGNGGQNQQLLGTTETGQFVLNSLPANFTPSAFSCSASNSIGSSDQSNQIELQLSYTPGPSFVRPVNDPQLRKTILLSSSNSVKAARALPSDSSAGTDPQQQHEPLAAGKELMLECVTQDLGQPRANIWLWFKNGQPIDSSATINSNHIPSSDEQDLLPNDNPITGRQDLLSASYIGAESQQPKGRHRGNGVQFELDANNRQDQQLQQQQHQAKLKLINSGRYLFSPSIQLANKGNYSCVAVNRLGSSLQPPQSSSIGLERDSSPSSYQLRVALAPSFVQPLASQTYWSELPQMVTTNSSGYDDHQLNDKQEQQQLQLICHVQCEPICQIEWLRNNEPLDFRRQSDSLSANYVTYQVKQAIMDEDLEANLFTSIESRLVILFNNSQEDFNRNKILERRHLLSGVNYTCQSSPNSMGPSVRSTTKFVVQYAPENVLINSPSDKLSLVEESNGPRLSCEASGEPEVQYRWFLLKGSTNIDLAMAAAATSESRHRQQLATLAGIKRSFRPAISQSSSNAAGALQRRDYAINQIASKAFEATRIGANDGAFITAITDAHGQNLIELANSASEQGGVSILDLSNLSLDRRQAGHYICEASNRLGQARQSVYVNVLYKPTCASLHLYSLDLTVAPSMDNQEKKPGEMKGVKPFKATINDQYSIVRETSEDFIDLRRILVLAPLLNRPPDQAQQQRQQENEDHLLKGSIFETILSGKRAETAKHHQLKDKDALIHTTDGEKGDISQQNHDNSLTVPVNADSQNGDSWTKFNMLLLRFLNSYMKQVKTYEEKVIDSPSIGKKFQRQNRRSSSSDTEGLKGDTEEFNPLEGATRNLLTFACMAHDANPINNLTFDWSFGSTSLLEQPSQFSDSMEPYNAEKPMLIYSNENHTLQVMLVRRLDTRANLSPFQMSLLTLDVLIWPSAAPGSSNPSTQHTRSSRQSDYVLRAPVIKNRYQSFYSGLRGNQNIAGNNGGGNNNIQFANEFDTKMDIHPGGHSSLESNLELDEQNWQEQLGNLLKCSVANQIGTSEVCQVRVNLAERLKSQSSSSEFARWRMPSLAHKSLLIISILMGCALIIFVTSALLLGPYLRGLNSGPKRQQHRRACAGGSDDLGVNGKEEINSQNTGQSTSSQKSSVLGLLGNGDSSLQGSSDDDSSARLNHNHNHHRHRMDNNQSSIAPQNRMLDLDDISMGRSVANGYHQHHHQLLREQQALYYDQPRSLHDPRAYPNGGPNAAVGATYEPYQCTNQDNGLERDIGRQMDGREQAASGSASRTLHGSAGSRLLANLKFKSLCKFKADRISDLSNLGARLENLRNFHRKNISSSETTTTGLSALEGDIGDKITSPSSEESPTFFGSPKPRHQQSLSAYSGRPGNQLQVHQLSTLEPSYFLYDQNGLQSNGQLISEHTRSRMLHPAGSTLGPAYSNMMLDNAPDTLDEFIRQREPQSGSLEQGELSAAAAFYRSQSTRSHPLYLLKNDLSNQHFQPHQPHQSAATRPKPPVFPRSQHSSSAMFRGPTGNGDNRPPVAARLSHRHLMTASMIQPMVQQQHYLAAAGNRFSMLAYNESFGNITNEVVRRPAPYMDTIDSHLNRLADSAAASIGHYSNQQDQQLAYANALEANSYNQTIGGMQSQSAEHIYDVNAYATPEQTPLRRPGANEQIDRPRVSQLIQSFNAKVPQNE